MVDQHIPLQSVDLSFKFATNNDIFVNSQHLFSFKFGHNWQCRIYMFFGFHQFCY